MLRSLRGDWAFRRLRKARSGGSRLLGIRWRPTRNGFVAVGIVVSKKVGKAVVRNRVRRRIREAFAAVLREELEPRAYYRQLASFDIMVVVRPDAAKADYWQLKAALERAMERGQLR